MTEKILTIIGYDPLVPDQWVDAYNIQVQDGNYADYASAPNDPTGWLLAVASINQIPVGSIIEGIALRIRRNNPDGLDHHDHSVYIMNKTTLVTMSDNKKILTAWPNGISDAYYGGSTDMWNSVGVDASFINSGNFAIGFKGIKIGGTIWTWFNMDYFEIKIYYTSGGIPSVDIYGPAIQSI